MKTFGNEFHMRTTHFSRPFPRYFLFSRSRPVSEAHTVSATTAKLSSICGEIRESLGMIARCLQFSFHPHAKRGEKSDFAIQ